MSEYAVTQLPSRAIQIQVIHNPGDSNSGPHVMLFALLETGAMYCQYFSDGRANVPRDQRWYQVEVSAQ